MNFYSRSFYLKNEGYLWEGRIIEVSSWPNSFRIEKILLNHECSNLDKSRYQFENNSRQIISLWAHFLKLLMLFKERKHTDPYIKHKWHHSDRLLNSSWCERHFKFNKIFLNFMNIHKNYYTKKSYFFENNKNTSVKTSFKIM